jgi:ribosomal protein L11 methylase PrmA
MNNIKIKNENFIVENDDNFWKNISNWEIESFNILDYFLNKENLFIDIGAWNGVLSIYASKLCKYVHSFEPDVNAYNKLVKNIELNNIENIKTYLKGVSNIDGFMNFYIRNYGDSVSSLKHTKQQKSILLN